jgi:hypothetical protein
MRTSNTCARKFRSTVGKIVMALVLASMIGALSIAPAFGRDDGRRGGYHGHGRYGHGRYEYQSRGYYRGYRPYGYSPAPVYAPPPVIYAPAPYESPGIRLVFPIRIR